MTKNKNAFLSVSLVATVNCKDLEHPVQSVLSDPGSTVQISAQCQTQNVDIETVSLFTPIKINLYHQLVAQISSLIFCQKDHGSFLRHYRKVFDNVIKIIRHTFGDRSHQIPQLLLVE